MVQVAGIVTGRQRPGSASGVMFVTLEDETGNVNVVVWTSIQERFRAVLLQGQLLKVKGIVEREKEVIHVVAGFVEDATTELVGLTGSACGAIVLKRPSNHGTSAERQISHSLISACRGT